MNHDDLRYLLEDYGDGDSDSFVKDAHQLLETLRTEMESLEWRNCRQKPPSRWNADIAKLLKHLNGLDPRLVSHINQMEASIWGQDSNSFVRLITVLEGGLPKSTPLVNDVKHVCMMLVAGFCKRWELSVEKSKLCGFYVLIEILKPELGVDWDTYKLADIAIPLHRRLFPPDDLQELLK